MSQHHNSGKNFNGAFHRPVKTLFKYDVITKMLPNTPFPVFPLFIIHPPLYVVLKCTFPLTYSFDTEDAILENS